MHFLDQAKIFIRSGAFVAKMVDKGVDTDPIADRDWGRSTGVTLPGGVKLGIYEAKHARP